MNIPEQPFRSQREADEDDLARAGFAIVSAVTMARIEDVEYRLAAGLLVSAEECEQILYAVYSGPYGDYHTAKVYA